MDMKRDLSCKICGTSELFVPFRENQWYRNYRLNSAAGCIRCVTFLSWLMITNKEPKNGIRSVYTMYIFDIFQYDNRRSLIHDDCGSGS